MAINTVGFDGPPEVKPEYPVFDWDDALYGSVEFPAELPYTASVSNNYGYPDPSSSYPPMPGYSAAHSSSPYVPPPIKEPDLTLYGNSADPVLPLFPRSEASDLESFWAVEVQIEGEGNESAPATGSKSEHENENQAETSPAKKRVQFRLARCSKTQKDCMRDILQKEIRNALRAFNGEFSATLVAAALEQIHIERLRDQGSSQSDPVDVLHRFSKDQQRKLRSFVQESPKRAKRALQRRKIAMRSNEDIDRALLALRAGLVDPEEEGLLEQEEFQEKSE